MFLRNLSSASFLGSEIISCEHFQNHTSVLSSLGQPEVAPTLVLAYKPEQRYVDQVLLEDKYIDFTRDNACSREVGRVMIHKLTGVKAPLELLKLESMGPNFYRISAHL